MNLQALGTGRLALRLSQWEGGGGVGSGSASQQGLCHAGSPNTGVTCWKPRETQPLC